MAIKIMLNMYVTGCSPASGKKTMGEEFNHRDRRGFIFIFLRVLRGSPVRKLIYETDNVTTRINILQSLPAT